MRTPRVLSPYMLIQEFLRDDPWKLLTAVIMLNQTTAKQVWKILPEFFSKYSTCEDFILAPEDEVKTAIRTLGFQNRRYERLLTMSMEFAHGRRPPHLHGIGKYGYDSYRIFVESYLLQDVQDKELRNYVRWAQEEARRADSSNNQH